MNFVIITAGGIGRRMGSEIPKQFLKLNGKPVLMYTIEKFYTFNKDIKIILSLPGSYIHLWKILCEEHNFTLNYRIVEGGKTRFHSIQNALKEVFGNGIVAIHDGVRPLVNIKTIQRTFDKAEKYGNGIASNDIFFSLRKISKTGSVAVNREFFKEIQTPQTFNISIIKKAYHQEYDDAFTDDASVVEKLGEKIYLTRGNRENIKITCPEDMKVAEMFLLK